MEAWSSIGELREDVPPHARVIAMLHYLMMSRSTVSDVVRNMAMRDIGDTSVLRRVRIFQLSM